MSDIAFLPARRLAGLVRRRKIGCLELLDHVLARVARYNPALNAIVVTDIDRARRRARAADRALAKGESWGPLHGVPMTVKESFDVAGLPSTWGSPDHKSNTAAQNALAVDRLLGAGAVVFGKTNVPLWLADAQSFNAVYGTTNNPWDLSRSPGGSSGGAAAALAAGLTGLELGSDIASSIRNPAHYCGLFGHKPTWGICPPRGHALGGTVTPTDISVIGPLARAADDLALALSIIAGPDEIDAAGLRLALPPPRKRELGAYRVGIIYDHETAPVAEEVQAPLRRLARFLGRRKVRVSDRAWPDIDMDEAHRTFDILLTAATAARMPEPAYVRALAELRTFDPDDDSPRLRGLRGVTLSHRAWLGLNETRNRMRRAWHDFFRDWDLLLCPVLATAAPVHDRTPPDERTIIVDNRPQPFVTQLFWAGYPGMAYLPATVAPIGFTDDGLPVGVQIIGPQYGDRTCLHFARLLEREYQPFVPPPGYG